MTEHGSADPSTRSLRSQRPAAGTDPPHLADRLTEVTGTGVRTLEPIGGGIICQPHKAVLADGRTVFVKTRADAPAGFFEVEADGLRWLGQARQGAPVPGVVAAAADLLVLDWVAASAPTEGAARGFGRALAHTHAAEASRFGTTTDVFIGSQPLPAGDPDDRWPDFFARARLLPYLELARAAHAISPPDAAAVTELADRLPELADRSRLAEAAGGLEPPARVHGDLWSGNVMWTPQGATLIDPAAHGGHRLFDLAMLDLFGLPELEAVFAGYQAAARDLGWPLPTRWRQFLPVHQLFPLLVHAVHFGGRYGPAAGTMARRAVRLLD